MNFKKIKLKNSQQMIICLSITFIMAIIIWQSESNSSPSINQAKIENIDTNIPYGFNLHPLEISNQDSLNALVGDFAVVNLYQVYKNKKTKLVLQNVKLIRSPKDPRYFAALVRTENSDILSQYPGPFKVSIQNPKKPNELIEKKIIRQKRKIIVGENL